MSSRAPARSRYSRSRSRSPRYSRRYSRSRSRSGSPPRGSGRGSYRGRSHSRSPMSSRRRHVGSREDPTPSTCLGVFGLSLYTTERELEKEFSKFGQLEKVTVVLDGKTGRSRGFAFVYFAHSEDAKAAKETLNDQEIDGRRIRVDFSITKRAHTPTPGVYMGRPTYTGGSGSGGGSYREGGGRERYDNYSYRRPTPPRSPSPYYRGGRSRRDYRSRTRSRSYSPRRY